jgi:hypothetical protein
MQDILELHDAVNYRYLKSNSCGTVFIAIEMRSLKPPEDSIIRLSDLSLVMDCSSSMQGEKFNRPKNRLYSYLNCLMMIIIIFLLYLLINLQE